MKRRHLLQIFLLSLSIALGESAVWAHQDKRDLTNYDDGGTFDLVWEALPQHEQMTAKLREFVWKHWLQKRLGRVVVTFYSHHGDSITHNLFIEPDANGRWQVVSQYKRECCVLDLQRGKKLKRESGIVVYDHIARTEIDKSGVSEIPTSQIVLPTRYVLRLRSSKPTGLFTKKNCQRNRR